MDKDEMLDKALKQLFDVAFKDGVVDDAEFEPIEQIEVSIEAYADMLNNALLDDIITPEESMDLETLRDKILEDAQSIANKDGVIDDEEKELLKTLTKILQRYQTS